jgi:PIN domain nuclease of toxin-antitoxin system
MRLLLDTQAFLWFVTDDPRLSAPARTAIEDGGNERLLSIASVWEMAIKHSIGKLAFTEPFGQFVANETAANNINLLPVAVEHTVAVAFLPLHHRDPFDRILVAQAMTDNLPIVSSDEVVDRYAVPRIW